MVCIPDPWTCAAFPSTEAKLSCLAKGPGRADNEVDEGDEEDAGMAESLHSTRLSSTLPAIGTGAEVAPEVTVMAAVVMVTVAVLPSFLMPANAWQ